MAKCMYPNDDCMTCPNKWDCELINDKKIEKENKVLNNLLS